MMAHFYDQFKTDDIDQFRSYFNQNKKKICKNCVLREPHKVMIQFQDKKIQIEVEKSIQDSKFMNSAVFTQKVLDVLRAPVVSNNQQAYRQIENMFIYERILNPETKSHQMKIIRVAKNEDSEYENFEDESGEDEESAN